MIYIKKLYQILFILGIFFIPFNSQVPKWLGFLGEFSADSSPIFFFLSFLFLFIFQFLKGSLFFPLRSNIYNFFVLFVAILFISTVFNLPNVLGYYFKQTTGIERFLRQIISIIISSVIFFYVFINVCRDYGFADFFKLMRKIFFISFLFVFSCGFLQYLILKFQLGGLTPILSIYNFLPFVKVKLLYAAERISSLTYEPPALGTYLITIAGFMFSYIITKPCIY